MSTTAACPAVKTDVSTKITDVLAVIIYDGIFPSLKIEETAKRQRDAGILLETAKHQWHPLETRDML